ncbi:MAG TPA: DNA repair protein RadC [Chthoniobacteraceae bacterium]|nr:DNA repair protein RadC [Chthoniobacteraceae bacterium]
MPLRIQELPDEDRPREKLIKQGAGALSESELVAILLRTGTVGANAVDVARELLLRYQSLTALSRCDAKELAQVKGIGEAKALQLAAAFELGKRLARENPMRGRMDSPELVYDLLAQEMRMLAKESLRAVLLDTRLRLLRVEEIALGSLSECIAHPREVFRPALVHSAFAVILVHNHPSGDPTPSAADIQMSKRMADAARILQIRLLDHVIIGAPAEGRQPYYSCKESGVL